MDDAGNSDKANIRAENNSVAVGSLYVGGSVEGSLVIGSNNVVGFTSEQVSVLIEQISSTFQPKKFDGTCPYRGLDVFEEEDAELFFGRETLVEDLVGRVKESRTVFITGPSGSGKSSLVRAGLTPALKQGAVNTSSASSERWLYASLKPGRDPVEALASAFSRLKSPELGDYFQKNASQPDVLHKCAESTLSERKDQRLVVFIDQFEEVFTQLSRDIAETFIQWLDCAGSIENGRVILLPAGEFLMGSSDQDIANAFDICPYCDTSNEQPQHLVYLDTYQIGKYEVTNKQYYQCILAGVCNRPINTDYDKPEFENYPIVDINWKDAATFCEWNGSKLPTEAEWEKAARGDPIDPQHTRIYPWGNEWNAQNANVGNRDDGTSMPVGSYSPSGDSAYGVADMSGNVWEWVADWFRKYPNSQEKNPTGPQTGTYKVERGGSFGDNIISARSIYRAYSDSNGTSIDVGVRSAK